MLSYLKSERGQDLVEFTLILPILLLFLMGIVEFGIAGFAYNTITNAAREVARYGIIHPNQTEIDTYIDENLSRWTNGIHGDEIEVTSTLEQGALHGTVHVTVTYQYQMIAGPLIQILGGSPKLKLHTQSTMYTETFPD